MLSHIATVELTQISKSYLMNSHNLLESIKVVLGFLITVQCTDPIEIVNLISKSLKLYSTHYRPKT